MTLHFFNLNKLNSFIKTHKDPLLNKTKKNVVYKIYCKDCDASYVGQTERTLKTRILEHCNRRNTSDYSVITEHRLDLNHDFNWEGTKIVDQERFLYKWCISRNPIYSDAKKQQFDTEFLHLDSHCLITLI